MLCAGLQEGSAGTWGKGQGQESSITKESHTIVTIQMKILGSKRTKLCTRPPCQVLGKQVNARLHKPHSLSCLPFTLGEIPAYPSLRRWKSLLLDFYRPHVSTNFKSQVATGGCSAFKSNFSWNGGGAGWTCCFQLVGQLISTHIKNIWEVKTPCARLAGEQRTGEANMHSSPIPTAGLLLPIDVISCAYSKIVIRAGDISKTITRLVRLTAADTLPSSLI